jgi:uncharacterized phage-associated protein
MNFYREKLQSAVLLFCKNTNTCNTTKLLKLLAFFDFLHFKQTGYPAIGLVYYAWPRGPVPISFYEEIKGGKIPKDFIDVLVSFPQEVKDDPDKKGYIYKTKPRTYINETVFSPRETKIIRWLCDVFRNATAAQMTEVSHLHNSPWDTTVKTKGLNEPIDFLLCIDDESPISKKEAEIKLKEHLEMIKNFDLDLQLKEK